MRLKINNKEIYEAVKLWLNAQGLKAAKDDAGFIPIYKEDPNYRNRILDGLEIDVVATTPYRD